MGYSANDLMSSIRTNYKQAHDAEMTDKNIEDQIILCTGPLRKALESLVALVYLKKYGVTISFDLRDKSGKSLAKWMQDNRFTDMFNVLINTDLNGIRIFANNGLHIDVKGKPVPVTVKIKNEYLERFKKCALEIQDVLGVEIFKPEKAVSDTASTIPSTEKNTAVTPKTVAHKGNKSEREFFFDVLRSELDSLSRPPFYFTNNESYACVNRKTAKAAVALVINFLSRERVLRIGIYIEDDGKAKVYDGLEAQKEAINASLGLTPTWRHGNNGKARWIETLIPIDADKNNYTEADFRILAKKAIPIIEKYVNTFSVYLPKAF